MRFVLGLVALAGLAVLLMSLPAPRAEASAWGQSFELVPGVVIDPASDALYLMRPDGGIERVSISSGSRIWESQRADKPLALAGNQLLAQVEVGAVEAGLEIVLLDSGDGETVTRELRVDLPAGIRPGIDERMGTIFVAQAGVLGSAPWVSWTHTTRYTKGIQRAPDEALQETVQAAYQLDLSSGALSAVDPTALKPPITPLPAAVQTWMTTHAATEPPVETGEVIAAARLIGYRLSPFAKIVLERWARGTGAALPSIEVFSGPHVLHARSVDNRHLLVTERRAPGELEEYEWSIFSLETGERVGRLRHRRSHSAFFVAGNTIVLVQHPYKRRIDDRIVQKRLTVEARVLGSGSLVWERLLRDTRYKGPFPP